MQLINPVLRWPNDYQGPDWGHLMLRAVILVAGIGIAILVLLLFIVSSAAALALVFT